jgi:integrase
MSVAMSRPRADAHAPSPPRKAGKMGKVKIRYFVTLPGAKGSRYFWQPSSELRVLGWRPQRLDDSRPVAIAEAEARNAEVEAWRRGDAPPPVASGQVKAPIAAMKPGSLGFVIAHYKTSRRFPKNEKTRRSYLQNIKVLEEWAGEAPVVAITPARVEKLYTKLFAKTESKAAAVVTMLRILLGHAMRMDPPLVKSNAAANPGLIGRAPSGRIWPVDAVDLFVEIADHLGHSSVGTAVMINHWLGQRQADILAMKPIAYRNGWFMVRQRKTDARVGIPHSPKVAARVELELQRQTDRWGANVVHPKLLIAEETGRPWKEDHFRHVFSEIRAAMAEEWPAFFLEDDNQVETAKLWYMHLRHTAVTELATAGCTPLEISGITGHTVKTIEQILSRYLVRTAGLASAATTKRLAAEQKRDGQ